MSDLERSKSALIRIYQILKEYSDYNHPLTQQDIIDKLDNDYGLSMERKAIRRNLGVLEDSGIEIEYLKTGCYLANRTFSDAELRMIIDSVLSSKHLDAKKSKKLIEKLSGEANKYFRSHIKHVYTVSDSWNKTENEALYYNIELIDTAIEKKRQIHYDYNKYGVDKKLYKSSQQYVSPYQLILHNQRYYLMAYSEYWKNMVYHRLDHITNMSITDKPATLVREVSGYENGIDYKRFSSQMPYMYADDPVYVDFNADVSIIDQLVDWFGNEIRMHCLKDDDTKVRVTVKSSPLAMKHWALQYLDYVEVISPESIRADIRESLAKAEKKYT